MNGHQSDDSRANGILVSHLREPRRQTWRSAASFGARLDHPPSPWGELCLQACARAHLAIINPVRHIHSSRGDLSNKALSRVMTDSLFIGARPLMVPWATKPHILCHRRCRSIEIWHLGVSEVVIRMRGENTATLHSSTGDWEQHWLLFPHFTGTRCSLRQGELSTSRRWICAAAVASSSVPQYSDSVDLQIAGGAICQSSQVVIALDQRSQ